MLSFVIFCYLLLSFFDFFNFLFFSLISFFLAPAPELDNSYLLSRYCYVVTGYGLFVMDVMDVMGSRSKIYA